MDYSEGNISLYGGLARAVAANRPTVAERNLFWKRGKIAGTHAFGLEELGDVAELIIS